MISHRVKLKKLELERLTILLEQVFKINLNKKESHEINEIYQSVEEMKSLLENSQKLVSEERGRLCL